MNYKETILKNIKFKHKSKWIDDSKSDLLITVPLTNLLDAQAKISFAEGVAQASLFFWML